MACANRTETEQATTNVPRTSDKPISLRRAAQLIFSTERPTDDQVTRIRALIAQGDLEGDMRSTTMSAVATLMARTAYAAQHASEPDEAEAGLTGVYYDSFKDYFLTVLMQRKVRHASKNFRRAVLAGQVVLLCLAMLPILLSFRLMFAPPPPEQQAVTQWLEANEEQHRIIQWHEPFLDDEGRTAMRVQYRYITSQGRGIDTDRLFVIQGDQVVSVESEW